MYNRKGKRSSIDFANRAKKELDEENQDTSNNLKEDLDNEDSDTEWESSLEESSLDDEDDDADFDDSTNNILDTQMDGVFKPKPKKTTTYGSGSYGGGYRSSGYGGYGYNSGYGYRDDYYADYDDYDYGETDKRVNSAVIERKATNIIENMELYPSAISGVAQYQSAAVIEEIIRQLLNR